MSYSIYYYVSNEGNTRYFILDNQNFTMTPDNYWSVHFANLSKMVSDITEAILHHKIDSNCPHHTFLEYTAKDRVLILEIQELEDIVLLKKMFPEEFI